MGLEPEARRRLRRIVCDTAPLVSLRQSDLLEILPLAGRIYVPTAVRAELQSFDPLPEWLKIEPLEAPFAREARAWVQAGILDPGESEAIGLVRQLGADWLLTDDSAARLLAQRDGIEVHGSLGLVLWAAGSGHFDLAGAHAALDALSRSSLWISARVLAEARTSLPELCVADE